MMNINANIRNKKPSEEVKSIAKAMDILKALSKDTRKLSDIARKVTMSKSTVHRLLHTLKEIGLAVQDPVSEEYFPGPQLFQLVSNPFQAHQYLVYSTYFIMDELRNTIGESVSLDIKYGMEKLKLQQLTGSHNIAFVSRALFLDQLWSGASGKVLLAQLPVQELQMILPNIEFTPLTPRTITDKAAFVQEIAKVRERGHSTSIGETELGVAAIAVPIRNYVVPVSLAFIGPEERITHNMMDSIELLKAKAQLISENVKKTFIHNI